MLNSRKFTIYDMLRSKQDYSNLFKGSRKEVKQEIWMFEKLGYVYTETAVWIYWQLRNREVLCLIAALVAAWVEAKQKKNKEKRFYVGHV
jgi:hypothetical protein